MPSPIRPSDIEATVPSVSSDLCSKFKLVLITLPRLLSQFFDWFLNSDGTVSTDFLNDIAEFSTGDYKFSFNSYAPSTGWLLCDGQAVSRTTYAALFTKFGTTFGAGDGSTTFNLPDAKFRHMVMANDPSHPLGQTGGEETHTMTIGELVPHTHTYQYREHPGDANNGGANGLDAFPSRDTGSTGGGAPFNVMNPFVCSGFWYVRY